MSLSIDEIYDLFTWDASFSDEEYAKREQMGIAEASKLRNIYPFIQPIIAGDKSCKSIWDSCAKVVAMKSDEELEPYYFSLFEWLQDMNWPGAYTIFNRLSQIPFHKLEDAFHCSKKYAEKLNDEVWITVLNEFKIQNQLQDHRKDPAK